ncbi:FG-GAP repeat protein [Gilvimarinus agarilyticus]|uniref:FG-GAP repeat protein n=1 Tax=Gilvimarinus agarilyticus TaxID=679259 RepID=UPI0005A18EE6|nr:FG-GAP repeat protein [Gilvimarinus agarilyticus]
MSYRVLTASVRWSLLCASVALVSACGSDDGQQELETIHVTASSGEGGTVTPTESDVIRGASLHIRANPELGYKLLNMTGCDGAVIEENHYKTAAIEAPCHIQATFETGPIEEQAELEFSNTAIARSIGLKWNQVPYALRYTLFKNIDGTSGFTQLGPELAGDELSYQSTETLYDNLDAQYMLEACNDESCLESDLLITDSGINQAIGYFKRSVDDSSLRLGTALAFSGDGETLAASAPENCSADNDGLCSGVVYIYRLGETRWELEASIELDDIRNDSRFGERISLSRDGNTIAISAPGANSSNNSDSQEGAVYIYRFESSAWGETHEISGADQGENATRIFGLGADLALNASGDTLAIVAQRSMTNDGQALLYRLNEDDEWALEQRFEPASSISLDNTGNYLAIGARNAQGEANEDTGVGVAGVYHFTLPEDEEEETWVLQDELRAPETFAGQHFGHRVLLSGNARKLLVGVNYESTVVNAQQLEQPEVYLFEPAEDNEWSLSHTFSQLDQVGSGKSGGTGRSQYGTALAMSRDGSRVLIGDSAEDGNGTGFFANDGNNAALLAGAAYLYNYVDGSWQEEVYLKAKNTGAGDEFGKAVSISGDGDIIAVGAPEEDGPAVGVDTEVMVDSGNTDASGAVYLY